MAENQILSYHEWGIRVSRLMELIAMTNQTIKRHRQGGSSEIYISQYEDLLKEHTEGLHELMQIMDLEVSLRPILNAA